MLTDHLASVVVSRGNKRGYRRIEKRQGGLVCDVHGVACFKPEKRAKWKHVKACLLFIHGGTCVLPP